MHRNRLYNDFTLTRGRSIMKAVIYMYEKVLLTEEEIAEDTGISLRRVRKIIRRYLNGVAISKI